ncbi:hypothetical protein [Deinococcus indicus]|uniref:hypothetical protein n=1 Tax=Deinococcus indicus TaxID=223556 RepID=UPI001178C038|nr:hypothetical protein [Deinococcus indicus]
MSEAELLEALADYVRREAILPTPAEWEAARGDLPTDLSSLGDWQVVWRGALRLALARREGDQIAARVLALFRAGLSQAEIGRQLNLHPVSVYRRVGELRTAGLLPPQESLWVRAQGATWPASITEMALRLYGSADDAARDRARVALMQWHREGLIRRVRRGLYERC